MLEDSDFDFLLQNLSGVEQHWEKIGRGLGLDEENLKDVQMTSNDCLRMTLRQWFQSLQSLGYVPTWRGVCDALRSCEAPQLADQLEAKYCPCEFNVIQHSKIAKAQILL